MIMLSHIVYNSFRNNKNIGYRMLKIILPIGIGLSVILCVGYLSYLDVQKKKQQEVLQIIKDANQSIKVIESNPYNQRLLTQSH